MPDTLIVAEKPSVARDIARVVGATQSRQGSLSGNGYVVTWAIGHLVTLPEPHEISLEWKVWRTSSLPMLPATWPLKVVEATQDQFKVVKKLLVECADVICATDAGREGELIFRYIYEASHCRKKVRRLWISSLTPDAIRAGMKDLKEASRYDSLADAARARSRADWLVGMNLSRAYAITHGDRFFVGRVQTPTLALVVKRDREIEAFKPEDYIELEGKFGLGEASYTGLFLGDDPGASRTARLPPDGKLASEITDRVKKAAARVQKLESRNVRQPPPVLYDLTELQRHSNRLFGLSAARTLEVAQALYERHKLISYPRTDSSHLSKTVEQTLKGIVAAISAPYKALLRPETGLESLSTRYVDDSKVSDHHAILPTDVRAQTARLTADERNIYDLICRRLLALWQGDYVTAVTTVLTLATPADYFRTQGTLVVERGWKALEIGDTKREADTAVLLLPESLATGVAVDVADVKPLKKVTRPPPFLNDASILAAMESAGRNLEDRELRLAMRDSGLGTAATRAGIIEALLRRGYLARDGKLLRATELGSRLIDTVHPTVKSAELTGRWEKELGQIQAGKRTLAEFMGALEKEIRERVEEVVKAAPPHKPRPPSASPSPRPAPRSEAPEASRPQPSLAKRVDSGSRNRDPKALLKDVFGFTSFRPHQEEVCRAVTQGKDVLLVMPTGAGKSLCYQLPGLARGGTTLVISPLVALIDDQVEKLQRAGLAAERIHSGRKREESRAVCHEYLAGKLDFLFIAPERLGVRGFTEMLQKRPISLIAIDEAHCISHWGHDFRPDYRLLGERLGEFRPAPVIALTATATPLVQQDIARQLGLRRGLKSIHGFRRTNIAIQLAELSTAERPDAIALLLKGEGRLPAIVYAPTRKIADSLADTLARKFRAEAYHAGMSALARERVQERYLRGDLEVIVATIAFGMGIDKANVRTVVHAALPGSVEGYYQEIGRAGRDGKPSRAVLFHAFADRKTHEFFFEKSYPDPLVLRKIHRELSDKAIAKDALRSQIRSLDDETFERAIDKLWIHKGAIIDPEENVVRGTDDWEKPYLDQREHRLLQLRQIIAFTDGHQCRMRYLVEHFGDQNDSGEPCGICDVCQPSDCGFKAARHQATVAEQAIAIRILSVVSHRQGYAVGRLHQDLSDTGEPVDRKEFENILSGLVAQGWLKIQHESFQKEGQTIAFRKVFLSDAGEKATGDDLAKFQVRDKAVKARRKPRKSRSSTETRGGTKRRRHRKPGSPAATPGLLAALKEWRLGEARKKRMPAFRVLTDAVLKGICEVRPSSEPELLEVSGLGPKLVARYGEAVLRLVEANS